MLSAKQKILLAFLLTALCLSILPFTPWKYLTPGYHRFRYTPARYQMQLRTIERSRQKLAQENSISPKVKTAFVHCVDKQLFPYWYGTFWSFHGTTQTPGRGTIACGYFVTTVLRDAGLKLNRSQLAQMLSEEMIRTLVQKPHIQTFSNVSISDFVKAIQKSGKGLYVVGLDSHTGFIVHDNAGVRFVHASGAVPFCVVREEALSAFILKKSRYRIVGKISDDEQVLRNWLQSAFVGQRPNNSRHEAEPRASA